MKQRLARAAAVFADATLPRVLEVIDRRRPITQLRPLLAPALIDTVVTLTQRPPDATVRQCCAGYGCARGFRRRRTQRRGGVRDLLGYLITGLKPASPAEKHHSGSGELTVTPAKMRPRGVGSPSSAAAAGLRGVEHAAPGRRGTLRVSRSSSSPTDTPLQRPGQQRIAVIRPAGTRLQAHKSLNPGQRSPSGLPDVSRRYSAQPAPARAPLTGKC